MAAASPPPTVPGGEGPEPLLSTHAAIVLLVTACVAAIAGVLTYFSRQQYGLAARGADPFRGKHLHAEQGHGR